MLIPLLMEYSQRKLLADTKKVRFSIKTLGKGIGRSAEQEKQKEGELYLFGNIAYIIPDMRKVDIKKIDLNKGKISKAEKNELDEAIRKAPKKGTISRDILKKIEDLIDKKIEIIF